MRGALSSGRLTPAMNNGCGDTGVRQGLKREETTICPRRPLGLFQTGVPDGHLSPSQMSAPLSTTLKAAHAFQRIKCSQETG